MNQHKPGRLLGAPIAWAGYFAVVAVLAIVCQYVGIPIDISVGIVTIWSIVGVFVVVWLSREINDYLFRKYRP